MSAPRPAHPNRTLFITRRCTQRAFLLKPCEMTNQAFLYCLGEAAERCNVALHWVQVLSNHYHLGCYDSEGRFPELIEQLHKMVAKVMNAHWGRWENFWATEQTSVVELVEPHDSFDKMIYSLTNPVKDHLVERVTDWPGASSLDAQLFAKDITVRRPHKFFADDGAMPEEVTLRFTRPRGFEHLSHEAWVDKIRQAIAEREASAARDRAERGIGIVGRKQIRRQSPFDSPNSHAPRRKLSPRVAAKNKWRRIEVLQRNKRWQLAYAEALKAYRTGEKPAVFPAGTYKLRVQYNVACEPAAAA